MVKERRPNRRRDGASPIVGRTLAVVAFTLGIAVRTLGVAALTLAVVRYAHADSTRAVATAATAPTTAQDATKPKIDALLLHAEGIDFAELLAAIRLRRPSLVLYHRGRRVGPSGSPPAGPQVAPEAQAFETRAHVLFAFADVRTKETQIELLIIVSDGRAYVRSIDLGADPVERSIASTLDNLLAAIEDHRIAPDRENEVIPEEHIVAPPLTPAPKTPPPRNQVVRPISPAPPTRRFDTTTFLAVLPTLPLARPMGVGHRFVGTELGVDVGLRRLAFVGAAGRFAWTEPSSTYRMLRIRVALGGGLRFKLGARERFILPVGIFAIVEPWRVRRDGAAIGLDPLSTNARMSPLTGGLLRLEPGWQFPLPGRDVALRLSLRAELQASVLATRGGGALSIVGDRTTEDAPRPEVFAAGGLEWGLGVVLGIYVPGNPTARRTTRSEASASRGRVWPPSSSR